MRMMQIIQLIRVANAHTTICVMLQDVIEELKLKSIHISKNGADMHVDEGDVTWSKTWCPNDW